MYPAKPTNKDHRDDGTAHPGHPGRRTNHRSESTLALVNLACEKPMPSGTVAELLSQFSQTNTEECVFGAFVRAFLGEGGVNTPPNKSSKAITPSVKTIEVNLAVSCGLAGRAPRPSRQTKTTERLARPTLATQAGVKSIEVKLVVSRGSLALPSGQRPRRRHPSNAINKEHRHQGNTNHGHPNRPTVPSDSLGWDGEERPDAPKPKRSRLRRCVGRRGSPPQAPKQARKQNTETKQPQVFSPKATDTKARPPNQFNNPKTKRPREAQRPGPSKPSPPS